MAIKPELQEVFYDNLRTNQIGETDGVSQNVASDLGYHTLEQLAELSPLPGTPSIEVHESDAYARGVARAKAFKNDPNASGSDWPTAVIGKKEKAEPVVCADCAPNGCNHIGRRADGSGYTRGY